MIMSANPQFMAKHVIEEQERAARNIARIVVCLLTAFIALSFTTYRGYAHHAALCRMIDTLDASKLRSMGEVEFANVKTVLEECQ